MDYAEEFMREHDLGPDSEVWLVDYCLPSYLPNGDDFWLIPTHSDNGELLSGAEVARRFVDYATESYESHYEDVHATDCADCADPGISDCQYMSDSAYLESVRSGGDIGHHLDLYGAYAFRLDYPNNGYGEVWECRKVTFRAMGYVESCPVCGTTATEGGCNSRWGGAFYCHGCKSPVCDCED